MGSSQDLLRNSEKLTFILYIQLIISTVECVDVILYLVVIEATSILKFQVVIEATSVLKFPVTLAYIAS